MSTRSKFPASGIGFGLSHIDHMVIGNILGTISVVAITWLGFAVAIAADSALAILQAIDGITLKKAVDSWATAPAEKSSRLSSCRRD